MIKNPCYFVNIPKDNSELITAICLKCKEQKNLKGLYWDKEFNEADNLINCHFCQELIFKR